MANGVGQSSISRYTQQPYSFSDVTGQTEDQPPTSPPPPSPSFIFRFGSTEVEHTRVILPLEYLHPRGGRGKKKDFRIGHFIHPYRVEDTCPPQQQRESEAILNPGSKDVMRKFSLFSFLFFFFVWMRMYFHPLEKFATFCTWILYRFIISVCIICTRHIIRHFIPMYVYILRKSRYLVDNLFKYESL